MPDFKLLINSVYIYFEFLCEKKSIKKNKNVNY